MDYMLATQLGTVGQISRPAGILEHLERGGGPGRLDRLIPFETYSTEAGQDGYPLTK